MTGEVLVRGETISNAVWEQGKLKQQDAELARDRRPGRVR